MNAKKTILTFLVLVGAVLVPAKVLADQYGEVEVTKDITIDKKVKKPDTNDWYDNLFASDYKFKPDQEVEFKVTVKNVGDKDLDQVGYRDTLPSYLYYLSGDVSATLYNLKVDEAKDFYFKAKVVGKDSLPDNAGTYCVVNTAYAWIEGGESENDTAQVCIVKEGEGFPTQVTVLPQAGPANSLMILFGSGSLALTGWALIKKR